MDLNTFKAQLNARLSEFNDNEEGYVYYIASDARNYYRATDAAKLQGCESVTISVTSVSYTHLESPSGGTDGRNRDLPVGRIHGRRTVQSDACQRKDGQPRCV